MRSTVSSRRDALKRLAAMTAIGAFGALRSGAWAGESPSAAVLDGFGGKLVRREDADYELWRQSLVWHMSKPKRYPRLIAQARNCNDVIAAVDHAARNGLRIAMRSGGHNSNGPSLRDDAMALDLSALGDVAIDAEKRIAAIGPGVRSEQLMARAREHGLFFPVPHCPSVGLGGFTLGGGIGWNYPQCGGMSTLSIRGVEVVTADGRKQHATPDSNPELYWAARGMGPGFFAAVTRLDLQLYPLPRGIMANSYIFPLSRVDAVTAELERIRGAHDVGRVELIALMMHHPEAPADAPPEQSKIVFFTAFAFEADEAAARAALQPFADSALAKDCLVKMEQQQFSFEGLYERFFGLDDSAGKMARYAVDNVLTDDGCATMRAMADHLAAAPGRDCHVLTALNMHLAPREGSCFSWKADGFVGCYAIWDHEQDDPRFFDWLARALPLMDPFAVGHYVNEVECRSRPDRFRQCFSEENWNRMEKLRAKYDPRGVFHHYLGMS